DVGWVLYATDASWLSAPAQLEGASMIAEACRAGRLQVLEDARGAMLERGLYGAPRGVQEPGSLAIVPLVKDGSTLGALVLEAADVKALTLEEARNLTVLGAIVTASLELAWQ